MTIDSATVLKRAPEQVFCTLDGEVALLNLKSTLYFGLDEVGAFIWQALSEPRSMSELCAAILDQFDVPESRCRVEVLEFLQSLERAGLIETASEGKDA